MADRVITRPARNAPMEVRGQACLADTNDGADDTWIFDDKSAEASEAAAGVGADTFYPVGVSLDHLMELYWRWKTAQVEASLTFENGLGGADQTDTVDYTDGRRIYPAGAGETTVTREAHLTLPAVWDMQELEFDFTTPAEPYPATLHDARVKIFGDVAFTGKRVVFYNDLYWPRLEVAIDFYSLGDDELGLYGAAGWIYSYDYVSGATTFTGTLTMSDATEYDIPMYYDSGATTPAPSFDLSCNDDYWPHKKTDGNPKYNAATGAEV